MKITLTFCLLSSFLLLSSCKTELPPATRVGANTVGAVIDDVIWLPQINSLRPNISSSYDDGADFLTATATNLGNGTYFLWEIQPVPPAATYTVEEWEANGIQFEYGEVADQQGGDRDPYPVVAGSGLLDISLLDTENGVFAGEFSFDVVAPGGDTVTIRDGRFDIRF